MKYLVKIIGYYLAFFLSVYISEVLLFSHSPCRRAYGLIIGFFMSLIYAYFAKLNRVEDGLFAVAGKFVFDNLIVVLGCCPYISHDLPDRLSIQWMVMSLIASFISIIPIVIVITFRIIKDRLGKGLR